MNKFWLHLKKAFVSLTLVLSMASFSLFSGCFVSDENGDGLDELLYGIRMTYSRVSLDENGDNSSFQEPEYQKALITQYLNISVEVLASLSSLFGRGISNFISVRDGLTNEFGEITIQDICFAEELESSNENYNAIVREGQTWLWANDLPDEDDVLTGGNEFARLFCSDENLFKMQVALYCINMGIDCSGKNGDKMEPFNLSNDKESIEFLASDFRVTHSGLIEIEQEMLVDFIQNNVIGHTLYEYVITDMVTQIFSQEEGETLKYPVVASAMVKDYYIKDIAMSNSSEDEEDSSNLFTMEIGEQYYKSMVFMPKTVFKFNGVTLLFQSTEDLKLTIYARLHEKDSEECLINEKVAEIQIHAGLYDDLPSEQAADFDFSITDLLEKSLGMTEDYFISEYNQDTDVKCFGGMFGTGIGDGLFDKYGRPLAIANQGEDVTLANLYKVTKESKDSRANINFEKKDSSYFELVFETDSNKPFNIGFLIFDYDMAE